MTSSAQNVRPPGFFGGALGAARAGGRAGGRVAGVPGLVAGEIAVAAFGAEATGAGRVADLVGATAPGVGGGGGGIVLGAPGVFGVVCALVVGAPMLLQPRSYSVMRRCSASAFLRRSLNQFDTGTYAIAAPITPAMAPTVTIGGFVQLVVGTAPDAT